MADSPPPPTTSISAMAILPWAWVVELLSDLPYVPLPLLAGLVERVPEYSGKWFEDARERFALRCLQDVLDSGFHARVDASGGARVVDVGLDDSCEDAVRKLAMIKAEGKITKTTKHVLEQFIQQKRANLAGPFLHRVSKIVKDVNALYQSSENELNNVKHEEVYPSDRNHTPERMGNKDESINVPLEDLFNKSLVPSENMDGNLASGGNVQYPGNKFVSEINENNIDSCILEKTPVKQPSGIGDVLPPLEHADGYIAGADQNPEHENGIGNREILSSPNCISNDGGGDLKNNDAQKVVVEKLKFLLGSQSNPNTLSELTEQVLCFKCGEGGVLLTCCSSGCTIAIHAYCLGLFKELEESGKFYCSFCSYLRAHALYLNAKKKVSVAKKELSAFLRGIAVKDGDFKNVLVDLIKSTVFESKNQVKDARIDHQCRKSTSEQLDMQAGGSSDCCKKPDGLAFGTKAICSTDAHSHDFQMNDIGGTGEMNCQHLTASAEARMSLGDGVMVSSPSRNGAGKLKVEDRGLNMKNKESGKDVKHAMDGNINDEIDNNFILEKRSQKRRRNAVQPFFVPEKLMKLRIHEKGFCRKSPRNSTLTKSFVNLSFPVGRRRQLRWTAEEEKALKELVQRFSNNGAVIPWKTILEHGSHVFHTTRTPVDLKDKWKNILKYQDGEDCVSREEH